MSTVSWDGPAEAPEQPTTLPCPAWCGRGQGHGFDDASVMSPGLLYRDHETAVGPVVSVSAEEYAVGPEGPLWEISEPRAYLERQDGLDAREARQLAAALLQAADLIDGAR